MSKETILRAWSDEHGDVYRVGRKGAHYFIEDIAPAFTPHAGEVTRQYVSKAEAEEFDPEQTYTDLEYWSATSSRGRA